MLYKINTEFQKYSTEESAKSILSDLESKKDDISILDLSMNTFDPSVFSLVCDKIAEMKNLKHVILESILDSLTFDEMCSTLDLLSDALPKDLQALELPSNALSCNFPKKFENYISSVPLKILNLHNCGLGEDGLKRVSDCLDRVENKKNLTVLNLSKNRINVICKSFSEVLSKYSHLKELILNANTIEEKSMEYFLRTLKNTKIEVLNLTDNFVCGKAMTALGEIVLSNNIKELYLQDVKVDDGDIKNLLSIMKNKNIQELPGGFEKTKMPLVFDISCNFFEQECIDLLESLCEIFCFKKLIIFDNNFDDIDNLNNLVKKDGGQLIHEELDEESDAIEDELLEKFNNL